MEGNDQRDLDEETNEDAPKSTEEAFNALEWNRLLELAQQEARSFPAKFELEELFDPDQWASDLAQAQLMQQETLEVTGLLDRDALWGPLSELPDPDEIFQRLSRNAVLEVFELAILRRWLYAADSWIQIPREEIRGEIFKKTLAHLPDPLQPLKILDRVLTPEGELSEKASPKLSQLYSEIRSLRKEITNILDQLMKTFSQKGVLQENFSDVRDGRYVLPVKISSQGEVDGIIYEASASRQTVFIEPKEVGSLNNRLRQKQNELIQEIFVILEDTTKKLFPFLDEIEESVYWLSYWDCVQAKARLGRHYGGKPIEVTNDRSYRLHQTAHPLLWWAMPPESIIRNDIEFSDPIRTLLLTGPNTGGKTVLLKTLGLAGICARTGFPFPATDHPRVPFFDSFFADLGDAQSIEKHLSSFSGHVVRFKEILENITSQSLVLIDELNSATDPEEGAAFGRAVLETIMGHGAMVVTTTHDPHLKALAISDNRIVNASMAFDESSRTPTYRMVLGVPGRSRALETAERLGIPLQVIELARKYLSSEHNEFEKMLSKLEADTFEIHKAKKEAVALREQAEKLKKEWTERAETSFSTVLEKTRQKLRRVLEQAQDEVRASVKKLDEMKTRREVDLTRSQLNETFSKAAQQLDSAMEEEAPEIAPILNKKKSSAPSPESYEPPKLKAGILVRIPKWKSTGTVIDVSGSKVKVAMGALQMTLSTSDIEVLPKSAQKQAAPSTRIKDYDAPSAPSPKLDLRGKRFEEAMSELEHYLDRAYRSGGVAEVVIVHGLGTGALREGTMKLLQSLPYIKSYRPADSGQGGAGATIVEF